MNVSAKPAGGLQCALFGYLSILSVDIYHQVAI